MRFKCLLSVLNCLYFRFHISNEYECFRGCSHLHACCMNASCLKRILLFVVCKDMYKIEESADFVQFISYYRKRTVSLHVHHLLIRMIGVIPFSVKLCSLCFSKKMFYLKCLNFDSRKNIYLTSTIDVYPERDPSTLSPSVLCV